MINESIPKSWRALQSEVAQILSECGLKTQIEKEINTARGKIKVDIYVKDDTQTPPIIYLCECKYWERNVPQNIIHSFRSVVENYGANWGLIISKKGFQKGSYDAATYTNMKLLNWQQFQLLFVNRWYKEYLAKIIEKETSPLLDYAEPFNSRIIQKASSLSAEKIKIFYELKEKYQFLAILAMYLPHWLDIKKRLPKIPLLKEKKLLETNLKTEFFDDILRANSLRSLLESIVKHSREAIAEFDNIFGERG